MKKSRIGIEPFDVDLSMQSHRGSPAEEAEFSAFIARRKKLYAAQQRRAAARRTRTTGPAEAA